jgi:tRNA A37 threonylcarbamoyladenosine dehydratase
LLAPSEREQARYLRAGRRKLDAQLFVDKSRPMTDDYTQRFGGVGRLVGQAGLERLRGAHVCVIGVGGVGSWTVEGLARSGVGALTLIDLDDVCVTNVNRQLPALDGAIGRPKVAVLAERVRLINPDCRIAVVSEFFTASSAARLLAPAFDFVVDAIDRMTPKALLIGECRERGLGVVTVGSAGGKRDLTQIRSGDLGEASNDELLRQVRKKLRRDHGFAPGEQRGRMHFGVRCVWSAEPQVFPWADGTCATAREPGSNLTLDCESGFGTAVFVTGAFGLAAAQEVVRGIAERE